MDVIERLDITIQIVSFKIFEATHEFKVRIGQVKDERNRLLASLENRSELSLILNDLDRKITELEKELNDKIKTYKEEKIVSLHTFFKSKLKEQFRDFKNKPKI